MAHLDKRQRLALLGGLSAGLVIILAWPWLQNLFWLNMGTIYLAKSLNSPDNPAMSSQLEQSQRLYESGANYLESSAILENLGKIALTNEKWAESRDYLERLIEESEEQSVSIQWIVQVGEGLIDQERFAEAEQVLQQALLLEPESERYYVYQDLGRAVERQGKPEEALIYYNSAVATAPTTKDEARMLTRMGRISFEQGANSDALHLLEQAIQLAPDLNIPYLFAGDAYRALGQIDKARSYYEHVLRIDPTNIGAKRALENLDGK